MQKTQNKKRVGLWIRLSHEDSVQGESPEVHIERGRMYAAAKDWDVVEIYRLDVVSGKTVVDVDETKRMLNDVRRGHITGLIFSKLARLARNTRELLDFADLFKEHDADLISISESIDTSSPAGRLFYTLIAAIAQWEREEISARVAASVPIRAKMKKPLGGAAPYGFQWIWDGKGLPNDPVLFPTKGGRIIKLNQRLIPDPVEAPIRKRMYELFREHKRKKTVANILNAEGSRTRNGSMFKWGTIKRLLRDPTAKGLRRANYTRSLGNKKHWTFKPETDWVYYDIEPIVSEELWAQCNAILDQQKTNYIKPARRPVQLFSGLARCECGAKMYVPSNSPTKYICSKCRNKIALKDLEIIFHERLRNLFFSPDEIAIHLSQADTTLKDNEQHLASLENELGKLSKKVDCLYDLYGSAAIDKAEFASRFRPLSHQLEALKEAIPRTRAEIDILKIGQLTQDRVIERARDLYDHWVEVPSEDRRKIIESITEQVTVKKDEVQFTLFCAHPTPSGTILEHPSETTPRTAFDKMAMNPQGFIAATSWKRAGNSVWWATRETEMEPVSSGSRNTSST